jgi:predicted nucleic acid-binding Zn ribbon protein
MTKNTCIICGKPCKVENILPHGKVFCHNGCKELLNFHLNKAVPIVWMGLDDLIEREHLTEEEAKAVTPVDLIDATRAAADDMWVGTFGETFDDMVRGSAVWLEEIKVEQTPLKELPLLMGKLKYRESEKILTQRMKEEGCNKKDEVTE